MSGQTEPFRCPSAEDVTPIAPVSVSQFSGNMQYTTLSADSGFFRRHNNDNYGPDPQGFYRLDMETEAFEEAGDAGGDADYNDAYLYVKPSTESAGKATVYGVRANTGRTLYLHDWRGRTLQEMSQGSPTDHYTQPLLWGSYGMNLSAAIPGAKPWNLLYLDYTDWSAIVETAFHVRDTWGQYRGDKPGKMNWIAPRHTGRVNVGFLDTHVERLPVHKLTPPNDESAPSIWHPARPPGWIVPQVK
jgi:prepilin-type processing-associated H-X9-DG protein